MTKITLKAEKRKLVGRKVKSLRKNGKLPANIYGKGVKSESIEIDEKEFRELFKVVGETGIVEVEVGSSNDGRPVLIHNVQVHPATGEILHVDLRQVNLKEKITAQVPVEVSGESPVEKGGIGTVVLLLQELEAKALPGDLPEKFEVDASKLIEVDQTVKVGDLIYDKGKVEITEDSGTIIVKVEPPQKEVIEVVPVVTETEGEVGETAGEVTTAEEKPQEGEQPKETSES